MKTLTWKEREAAGVKRCISTARSTGEQCRRAATKGFRHCSQHSLVDQRRWLKFTNILKGNKK